MKLTKAHSDNLDKKYEARTVKLVAECNEYRRMTDILSYTLVTLRLALGDGDNVEMVCDECPSFENCPFYNDEIEDDSGREQCTPEYCLYFIAKDHGLYRIANDIRKEKGR